MSSRWRTMTLREVYPYWILGEVPAEDLPFIACNDMLAGTMDDEIVAVASLSQFDGWELDGWELDRVLRRAFARLGLPPMTEEEAAKTVAHDKMRDVARRLVAGEEDPLHGAKAIFGFAFDAGLFGDDGDVDEQVAHYGAEYLQLADALEVRLENASQKRQFEELIVEAAESLLAGQPVPRWHSDRSGDLHRGRPTRATRDALHDEDERS